MNMFTFLFINTYTVLSFIFTGSTRFHNGFLGKIVPATSIHCTSYSCCMKSSTYDDSSHASREEGNGLFTTFITNFFRYAMAIHAINGNIYTYLFQGLFVAFGVRDIFAADEVSDGSTARDADKAFKSAFIGEGFTLQP